MDKQNLRFAVCINNTDYPASLELHKIYPVLFDEDAEADGDLRVIDESGEDYLYRASYFVLINLPPLKLSVEDSEAFVDALLNPPQPNDVLKAAALRYKQVMSD